MITFLYNGTISKITFEKNSIQSKQGKKNRTKLRTMEEFEKNPLDILDGDGDDAIEMSILFLLLESQLDINWAKLNLPVRIIFNLI